MDCSIFDITTDTYRQRVFLHSADRVTFERLQRVSEVSREIDTFGPSWLIAITNLPKNSLSCHRMGKLIDFDGLRVFFLPPFSLVEWHLKPSTIFWRGYMSECKLPSSFPDKAISFIISEDQIPASHAEAMRLLENRHAESIIEKEEAISGISHQVKKYIDGHFCNDLPIQTIADKLGSHRVAMGREFKKCFGLSPIEYRSRLRIFHSTRLLRQGLDVTTVAYESGFGHLSRFQENFKRIMNVSPKEFCLQKKKPINPLINHGGLNQWKESLLPEERDL